MDENNTPQGDDQTTGDQQGTTMPNENPGMVGGGAPTDPGAAGEGDNAGGSPQEGDAPEEGGTPEGGDKPAGQAW